MNFRRIMPLVAVALVVLCGVTADRAEAQEETLTWGWSAASSDIPIDHYVVELWNRENFRWEFESNVTGLSVTVPAECNRTYLVRVAAVDVEGRTGPFSRPSIAYTHECSDRDSEEKGPPGAPGKPEPTILR